MNLVVCSSKTGLEVKNHEPVKGRNTANAAIGNDNAEVYYRINVTIPLLDQVLENMKAKVGSNKSEVAQGILFIPALQKPSRKHLLSLLFPFMQKHTLQAELDLWYEKWKV